MGHQHGHDVRANNVCTFYGKLRSFFIRSVINWCVCAFVREIIYMYYLELPFGLINLYCASSFALNITLEMLFFAILLSSFSQWFFWFGFALNRMSRNTFHLLLIPRSSTLRMTKVCLNHNIKWKLLSSLLHKLCLLSMTAQRVVSRRQQKTNFKRRQNLTKK